MRINLLSLLLVLLLLGATTSLALMHNSESNGGVVTQHSESADSRSEGQRNSDVDKNDRSDASPAKEHETTSGSGRGDAGSAANADGQPAPAKEEDENEPAEDEDEEAENDTDAKVHVVVRAVDERDEPVPDAIVTMSRVIDAWSEEHQMEYRRAASTSVRTDSQGFADLGRVDLSRVRVISARTEGYPPPSSSGALPLPARSEISGSRVELLAVLKDRPAPPPRHVQLVVRAVFDDDHRPAAGAEVTLHRYHPGQTQLGYVPPSWSAQSATADAQGIAEFKVPSETSRFAEARLEGHRSQLVEVRFEQSQVGTRVEKVIELVPAGRIEVDVQVASTEWFYLELVSHRQDESEDSERNDRNTRREVPLENRLDEGIYAGTNVTFDNVPAGEYELRLWQPGGTWNSYRMRPNQRVELGDGVEFRLADGSIEAFPREHHGRLAKVRSLVGRRVIEVSPGETVSTDIRRHLARRLNLEILDPDGEPLDPSAYSLRQLASEDEQHVNRPFPVKQRWNHERNLPMGEAVEGLVVTISLGTEWGPSFPNANRVPPTVFYPIDVPASEADVDVLILLPSLDETGSLRITRAPTAERGAVSRVAFEGKVLPDRGIIRSSSATLHSESYVTGLAPGEYTVYFQRSDRSEPWRQRQVRVTAGETTELELH